LQLEKLSIVYCIRAEDRQAQLIQTGILRIRAKQPSLSQAACLRQFLEAGAVQVLQTYSEAAYLEGVK